MANGLIWSVLLLLVAVFLLLLLVSFSLTMIKAPVGIFFLYVLLLWLLPLHVMFRLIAGLLPISLYVLSSPARTHSPLWPACWLQFPDRSRSSTSQEVRDIWDVYIREVGFVHLLFVSNSSVFATPLM